MKHFRFVFEKRPFFPILFLLTIGIISFFLIRPKTAQSLAYLSESEQAWLAENNSEVDVLFGYEAPPNAFRDEQGSYIGLLVDFLREIEEIQGIKYNFRNFATWDELIEYAKENQNFIIVGIAQTDERSEYLSFTDAFIKIPYVLVTAQSNEQSTLKDLIGADVCTVKNYAVNDYISQYYAEIVPQQVPDNLAGLRGVSTGQCDAMVVNQAYASYLIQEQGLVNLKIAGESGYLNRLSAATSINDPVLYGILDKTIDQIPLDRKETLYQKWVFLGDNDIRISPGFVSAIGIVSVVVLGVVSVLWLWSSSLQSTVNEQTKQIQDDYAQLQQIESNLRQSEQKYRGLIEQSNDAIFILYEQKFEIFNEKFLEMFALNREQVNAPDFDFLSFINFDSHAIVNYFNRKVRVGESADFEFTARKRTGEKILIEASVNRVHYKNGVATQGILRDITKRHQLEEEFRQAQKMEAVGRLAGGIAHDFNNLLTVINGQAELALLRLPEDNPLYKRVDQIHKSGERAASLTRQLLAFSRKQFMQPQVININELLNELHHMLERLIGEDISLTFLPDPNLGLIKADSGQIEQVVMNLVVNARDAMPNGGKLTIETANVYLDDSFVESHPETEPGSYVMISVSDSGVGMDKETQVHIFEPFFTTKGRMGTGLGLSTIYGIITQSRGQITVYSEVGAGSTFKIYLPCTEEIHQLLVESRPAEENLLGTETILVVEDERAVRDLVANILQNYGYDAILAANAQQALNVLVEHDKNVDFILTDVIMPDMSGPDFIKSLPAQLHEVPVLYMSGYTDNVILTHGMLEENKNFIEKPFSPLNLARKIREILSV
jgi:PAS domain S-box-containing protein